MAVYERRYRGYDGVKTHPAARFLVIPSYAYRQVFASRLFTAFFVLCLVQPLIGVLLIYLQHNVGALVGMDLKLKELLPITAGTFDYFLRIQAFGFGFVLVVLVGPGLISSDLRNNAVPLYLCRPLTRSEYVLGKFSVLAILLSAITWVPGLMLFAQAAYFEGSQWLRENVAIAVAIFVASWAWILLISLLALAFSAWVKWKPLASGLLVGAFIVSFGFAQVLNGVLNTAWGSLIDITAVIGTIWTSLLAEPPAHGLSPAAAWLAFFGMVGACLLILRKKIEPYEVVT